MNEELNSRQRLIIRLGRSALAFTVVDPDSAAQPVSYEPYAVNGGISMAANLREAIRTTPLLTRSYHRVQIVIDTPSLLVPVDAYDAATADTLYFHSFPSSQPLAVLASVLPELNCVALFAISKDLKLVIDDHFTAPLYVNSMEPVWRHLYQRSYSATRSKLFACFHDERLEVFSFYQQRFRFSNSFPVSHRQDALYYILNVWHQLGLQAERDELHLLGEVPEREELLADVRRFLRRAYYINPTGDFNRSPVTQVEGLPYDLMTLIVKGR